MALAAGKLNRRILIQQKTGDDEIGQPLDEWVDFRSMWAWHKPLTGRASLKGGVVTAVNGNSWRIRYCKEHLEIDTNMRVLYSEKPFNITRIVVDYSGKEYIDLICEESGSYA